MVYVLALVSLTLCPDSDQQALRAVWQGVQRLAQAILGASHVVQRVIPRLLTPTDPHDVERLHHFRHQLVSTLESQAQLVCRELQSCPGITVAMPPQGAMYCMVKVKGNDVDFCQRLLHEENVVVLPGQAFGMPHMVRLVVCAAPTQLLEAMRRMRAFCQRHYGKKSEE
jgi:tyrosine aminotransferase